jgi:hypothetical protein
MRPRVLVPGGSGPVREGPMEGRATTPGGVDPLSDAAALEGFFAAATRRACCARRSARPDLVVGILDRLAQFYGTAEQELGAVGWEEFEATTEAQIETLDEALFETAHLIAGLAAADSAVVMSKPNELLGFGGMISGRLPDIEREPQTLALAIALPIDWPASCLDRWRS